MPLKSSWLSHASPVSLAAAAFAMLLAGTVAAAEPADGCPDVSGEYENRASQASAGEIYLSDLLGFRSGVMRVIFLRRPDGMILRAPHYDLGMYELFLPWADFWCEGDMRILQLTKSNVALVQHEGQPIGGSRDRRVAFAKSPEGALLVNYSTSGTWIAQAVWGVWPIPLSGAGWARFEPFKQR